MIKIGSKNIKTNIFLAPLSGCSDLAFRLICREHGAKFCFFEMIDSNSIVRGPRPRTISTLKTVSRDRPIAAQLLGEDSSTMLLAAKWLLEHIDVEFIDINAACPVKKVVRKGAGSYLLKDRALLYKIIKTLSAKLPVPVTVKIRTGYRHSDREDIVTTAKGCEKNGAAAIFVHGRTRDQFYSGDIDYDAIKAIKDSVRIPVFGSGNIFDGAGAKQMLTLTNCDGILVARGSLGNPWIFDEIESYLKTGRIKKPHSSICVKKTIKQQLSYIDTYNDCSEMAKIGIMKKTLMWYFKGFPNATNARRSISLVKTPDEMLKLIDKYCVK